MILFSKVVLKGYKSFGIKFWSS